MQDMERFEEFFARHPGFEEDEATQDALWQDLTMGPLTDGSVPFSVQLSLYERVFAKRPADAPPPPAWRPTPSTVAAANVTALQERVGGSDYGALHAWSVKNPGAFWKDTIEHLGIPFDTPPATILPDGADPKAPGWLRGAVFNIADACFQAPTERAAIVAGSETSDGLRTVTYGELERLADRFASGLRAHGLKEGDAVAFYMPMTVECVAAYLGTVRAGCVVVSIPDSFAPPSIATRVRISNAKAVLTVDGYSRGGKPVDLYTKVREAQAPKAILVPTLGGALTLRDGDVLWDDFLAEPDASVRSAGPPERVTNVLFSSGTTGEPKGIPWTQLTPIKAAADGHYHQDIHRDDVVAWPTNIGWMMGPWLIYASLVNRATMALYDGLPTSKGFVRFVRDAGVTVLGLVPSIVRKWREDGAVEADDLAGVRVFTSTGEASNAPDYLWLMSRTRYRAPVVEYCGGTEIGGGHITGTVVQPASPATFSTPALGIDFVVLDPDGNEVPEGAMGELFLVPPSIGLSERLLNKDHGEVYYEGCPQGPDGAVLRRHGDQVMRLPGGYYQALGRADDTMNLGGIKVSSIELEHVVNAHPDVFESAAIAVQPKGGGADELVVYVVPAGRDPDLGTLKKDLQGQIKRELNPLFKIHDVVLIKALPRTASNKVMRRELRAEYAKDTKA